MKQTTAHLISHEIIAMAVSDYLRKGGRITMLLPAESRPPYLTAFTYMLDDYCLDGRRYWPSDSRFRE